MKLKLKKLLKKTLVLLIYILICFGIGYLIGILISQQFNLKLEDALFYVGIILVLIGVLLSMKGNPAGGAISGMGQSNAQFVAYEALEVTRIERESTNYYKNFFKHAIVEFARSNITLILSGILILVMSILIGN